MAKAKRTELRSSAGKKLYAVRDQAGKFEDIQTYQRSHTQDMQRVSQAELAKKAKPQQPAVKAAPKMAAPKMAAPKKATAKVAAPKTGASKKPAAKKTACKRRSK